MTEWKKDEALELRVWWIPQIPMKAFYYPVSSIEAGKTLIDALAKYDLFSTRTM